MAVARLQGAHQFLDGLRLVAVGAYSLQLKIHAPLGARLRQMTIADVSRPAPYPRSFVWNESPLTWRDAHATWHGRLAVGSYDGSSKQTTLTFRAQRFEAHCQPAPVPSSCAQRTFNPAISTHVQGIVSKLYDSDVFAWRAASSTKRRTPSTFPKGCGIAPSTRALHGGGAADQRDNGTTVVFEGTRAAQPLDWTVERRAPLPPECHARRGGGAGMWMSWKCSLVGLPFGGAKGGSSSTRTICPPANWSALPALHAGDDPVPFTHVDIAAPDMGTNEQSWRG